MKRTTTLVALAALTGLALPCRALAQPERYELGRRLGFFERAWDKQPDTASRKRALAIVEQVTPLFFSLRLGEAGKALDQARWALAGDKGPDAETVWADSKYLVPAARLVDAGQAELPFELKSFYEVAAGTTKERLLRLSLVSALGQAPVAAVVLAVGDGPVRGTLPLKGVGEGDYFIHVEIVAGKNVVAQNLIGVSVVNNLMPRLAAVKKMTAKAGKKGLTTDQLTIKENVELLESLARKTTKETDYPGARLLKELEQAVAAVAAGKDFYAGQGGQFWLRVPAGKTSAVVRVAVPAAPKAKTVPLVVALHGVGGSENLFFEAHGAGYIVKLCEERGWILATPRSGTHSVADLVDELARLYPVDKSKVFLVGHSTGVSAAVTAAQQQPARFAAVAALAGGGTVKAKNDLKTTPFFIGIGTKDFAPAGAKSLRDSLKKSGVSVDYREYADVEHLVVVREALPDLFALFDRIAKAK